MPLGVSVDSMTMHRELCVFLLQKCSPPSSENALLEGIPHDGDPEVWGRGGRGKGVFAQPPHPLLSPFPLASHSQLTLPASLVHRAHYYSHAVA